MTSYEADMRKTTHVGTSVSVTRTPPRYPSTPRAISETSQLFDFDGKARGSPTYTDIDLSFEDLDSASADAKASGAAAKVHSGSTHLEVLIEHNVLSNSHQAFKTSPSTNIIVGALEGWTEDWGSMSLSDLDFSPPTHESEEDLYGDFLTHGPSFPWMSRTPVLPPPTASGTKIDAEGNDECQDMLGPSPPPSPITSAIKAKAKLSKECDKEIDKLTDEVATHCENIQKYNDRAARSLATIQEARQKAVPDVVGMRKSAADAVLSSNAMLRHQEKMAAKAKALQKLLKQG